MRCLAALAFLTAGCSLYFSEPPTPTPKSIAERDFENLALPILRANCMQCHTGSNDVGTFLAGTTPEQIRENLLNFEPPVLDLGSPTASRLLTKGLHEGPSLTADAISRLLTWIEAERDEAGDPAPTPLTSGTFDPLLCISGAPGDSTCPLDLLALDGAGAPGARIQLTAVPLADSLQISNLSFTAGPTPVALKHPIFVAHVGGFEVPDPTDQLAGVVLSTTGPIGTGTVMLDGMFARNPISIDFDR